MRIALTGLVAASVCAAFAVLATPASAQLESREAISLQDQILELRHEMQARGIDSGAPVAPPIEAAPAPSGSEPGSDLTPQLLNRVATLEEEVRTLRGQVDQLTNQVQQQNAALGKQIGDLSFAAQQAHPPAAAPAPPARNAGRRPAEDLLEHGQSALGRHDYATAETDARQALAGASGPRQTAAKYLLAQALGGQRHYQQAATAYYDVYSSAPHSSRGPDALLGVSASLLALHDRTDACEALRKLAASYPHPAPHVRSAAATLRGRAGCP